MPISCIIVDDEPNALRLLEEYIEKISCLRLKGKFFDAVECLEFLKKEQIDLIFTDINMPGLSGLELAEILPSGQKIIFTTAFAEHALTSFRYHVIDYLLKPVCLSRFIQAVNKVESLIDCKNIASRPAENSDLVYVKSGRQVVKVDFREVLYIKGEREYIGIYTRTDRVLVYKRIKDIEPLLPEYFMRIHLSYIANTRHILKLESNHVFIGEVHLPIGDNYRSMFMSYLTDKIL